MDNIKTIIYSNELQKHEEFTSICKDYFNDIFYINNSVRFLREIMISKNTITIIFIEKDMANKTSESLSVLLKYENYYCVFFCKENISDDEYRDYINDYLQCNNKTKIENFMKRLNRNIYYRVKLFNHNGMLNRFYDISKQLSAEKDINRLFNLIVDYSMKISQCDAATIYSIVDKKTVQSSFYEKNLNGKLLKFMISKNNSMNIELEATTTEITEYSIIGASVINGVPIRIDDAYNIPINESYKFNKSFDEITGYRTQSVLTIPMKDHEDKVIGVIQLINKIEKGSVISFSISDETIIYSLAGQAAVVIENNILYRNLNELLEKNRDKIKEEINKRKNADEEINKLLSAVEHSPVGVMITDVDGRIQYVNPKLEQLSAYTYAEVLGKNPRIFKSNSYEEKYYKNLWKSILKGNDWHGEFYDKKKDGEYYWVNCYVNSVKDSEGNIKYFIAVQEDITEKKKLLAEIEEKNSKLEDNIEQLYLSQMQVIQSEKLAGIGQLAAGVAHEINNPLGFVISNFNSLNKYTSKMISLILLYKKFSNNLMVSYESNLILDEIFEFERDSKIDFIIEDIPEIIKESKEGLMRVNDIIKSLRLFSTVDQMEGFQDYDINENIKNTIIIMQNELSSIRIQSHLDTISLIKANAREFNQVILNILKNSVYAIKEKFDNPSQGIITIKTYSNEENVFMEIEDNGIGIEDKHLNKIFEPFFTTKPLGSGTGLGLSIAYDVVAKKHKGDISVSSSYEKGSEFTIRLPKS